MGFNLDEKNNTMNLYNKNIILLIKSPVLGGAERQALGFAEYSILKYNATVTVVATHSGECSNEFRKYMKFVGIDQVHFVQHPVLKLKKEFTFRNLKNLIKTFLYLFKMTIFLRGFKPYLIVPFLNPPSKLAVLIYKYTGAKYTFWHQLGLDYFTNDYLEKIAIKKTPLFIANAKNGIEDIQKHYPVKDNKLFCLPQYLSLEYEYYNNSEIKKYLNIGNNSIVIGMVSHYREEKLFDLLFDAFLKLESSYDIHLVFLGDRENSKITEKKYNYFNEKVEQLNLKNKISILSGYPVTKVLSVLDISVLVSTYEGTPNVVLEYMLYGLPVISTNHIGCQQLLKSNDLLINNDINELSEKLEFLLKNKKERSRIGGFNKKEIQKYSKDNYFKNLSTLLKTI